MSKPPENVRGAFVACKWQLELQGLLKKTTNKQTNNQTNKRNRQFCPVRLGDFYHFQRN